MGYSLSIDETAESGNSGIGIDAAHFSAKGTIGAQYGRNPGLFENYGCFGNLLFLTLLTFTIKWQRNKFHFISISDMKNNY